MEELGGSDKKYRVTDGDEWQAGCMTEIRNGPRGPIPT